MLIPQQQDIGAQMVELNKYIGANGVGTVKKKEKRDTLHLLNHTSR
jgi:hypothetical protein